MNIVSILLSTLISAAISGAIAMLLRISIESKYNEARNEAAERKRTQREYAKLQKKWQHAVGRVIYHLVRKAQGQAINGDLDKCYMELEEVEAQQKDMEQEQIVEAMND